MKALSNKFTNVTVGLVALVCASPAVLAHHSAVAFDPDSSVEVRGKVTQFIWRSPHLSINMDVTNDDGTIVLWKIEGQSIATMVAAGFDRTVMAEGDVITARVHPMRNGEPGGLLQGLISADGVAYSMDGPETPEQQRQVIPSLTAHIPPPAGETWQEREKKTRPRELPIISEGLGAGDSASTGLAAGTLDPSNLNKERPDAFFDLTGVWQYRGEDQWRANYGSYEFKPGPIFTAKGQAFYDAYQEAAAG